MVTRPEQGEEVVRVVRQEPRLHQVERARWRLTDVRAALPFLAGYTLGGVSKVVRRCGLRLKRGRLRLHSPDPAYAAKTSRIARARALAAAHPTRVAVWYADEVSCYRQPTLAPVWFPRGAEPTAELSHRANTRHRVIGALDAGSGRVVTLTGSKTGIAKLQAFLRALRAADPDRYLVLVWDNWPVHAHPAVLAESKRLRIRLLWLPTYAPWENPIEKLWRQLKQTILHGHRLADDWEGLKAAIAAFLDRFAHGSDALLHYVGLLPN